ncbi:MAG: hypothetical protein ACI9O4_001236 [Chitinophagales bacterium]|jgi:hypothetical protein
MESNINVICLESQAFYELVDQVVSRLKTKNKAEDEEWIDTEQAMVFLKISSKTTLQKLRDNGDIRFSQPMKRHILYFKPSLIEYLEKHSHSTF